MGALLSVGDSSPRLVSVTLDCLDTFSQGLSLACFGLFLRAFWLSRAQPRQQ